ncbi:DNA adenine methylase [Edaphobacter sp. 12200R-103]|uniref:DNA adenine methylase n=1 Tax=Edaphobacter sp. 12200R-103 TaxID=2703788 RepID=UPI00138D40C8|nr:DNA adenine methylase [Edaphobacter sp. 12200R-103]QHS52207.1 DNA adenine methylase [Edaphobacter sp. 12200R-103]
MLRTLSPLRYPGGKSCLYELMSQILHKNKIEKPHYIEPYAGGCGLALALLFEAQVSEIHLNDLDPSIFSFWSSVLDNTGELVKLVETTPVTPDEWERQQEIHRSCNASNSLELGFATFFLNRTNRSGVIGGAGMIGGKGQTGKYKLDCRFNREDLVRRIKRIAKYKSRIHLSNKDAVDFMSRSNKKFPEPAFFCIDPPYYNKGASLYTNFYGPDDHGAVADAVLALDRPWIVTYDNTEEIAKLYRKRRQYIFDINYSLQTKRVGSELLIASARLRLPDEIRQRQVNPLNRRAA